MPVSEEGIGCAYRGGDYWDATDDNPDAWQDELEREPIEGRQRFDIRHPGPPAGEIAISATRASTGDQDVSGVNTSGALYNEPGADAAPGEPGSSRSGSEQFGGTPRRRKRSGKLGQEQSVSYQAEERYWTDYLRIALPIAGLLLLLGVFWYWASSFIGDDADNDPQTPVAQIVETPITANTPTPTVSSAVTVAVTTVEPTQETDATQAPDAEPTATTAPATENGEDPGTAGEFADGDLVVVNDNDVNMRAEATTNSTAVTTLILGQELRILSSEPVEEGGYVWWNVEDEINVLEGWIAGDFIEPSS